jgi:hypothetical protein
VDHNWKAGEAAVAEAAGAGIVEAVVVVEVLEVVLEGPGYLHALEAVETVDRCQDDWALGFARLRKVKYEDLRTPR